MTILDAYQAIDEVVMQHAAGGVSSDKAMEYIAGIIHEQNEGE